MKHDLKTWPVYFMKLCQGVKQFEIRNNDRNFKPGDVLHLKEWDPKKQEYTGRAEWRRVGYILESHEGLKEGFVIMQLTSP